MLLRNIGICQPQHVTSHARIQPLTSAVANCKQQTFRSRHFSAMYLWERSNRLHRPQNPLSSISSVFLPTFTKYVFNNMLSSTVYLNHTYVVYTSIAIFIDCFSCVTDLLFVDRANKCTSN